MDPSADYPSPFDPITQNLDAKLIVALERLSEAFRVALWQEAKELGVSPIQIQILIFLRYHRLDQSKVSYLAKEFTLTKPTISDAVRVLETKGYLKKTSEPADSRSYSMMLTDAGRAIADRTTQFAQAFQGVLATVSEPEKQQLYPTLLTLIEGLTQRGLITQQRMCRTCRFFDSKPEQAYCKLLNKPLIPSELRIDCPEHELF